MSDLLYEGEPIHLWGGARVCITARPHDGGYGHVQLYGGALTASLGALRLPELVLLRDQLSDAIEALKEGSK